MTNVPKRIVDDLSFDPGVRALIDDASVEKGSPALKAQTLAALGLGGAAVAATSTAAAGTKTAGTAMSAALSVSGTTKIVTGLVLLIAAASGAGMALRAKTSAVAPPSRETLPSVATFAPPTLVEPGLPTSPSSFSPSPSPLPSPIAERGVSPSGVAPPSPPTRAPAAARTQTTRTESTPSHATTSLADEARSLEAARVALAAGHASAALAALDQHDELFPRGELAPETAALRVEALSASGDRSAARSLGQAFLERNPSHPAAARVRRVLADTIP